MRNLYIVDVTYHHPRIDATDTNVSERSCGSFGGHSSRDMLAHQESDRIEPARYLYAPDKGTAFVDNCIPGMLAAYPVIGRITVCPCTAAQNTCIFATDIKTPVSKDG
jgi:hypothetical protein